MLVQFVTTADCGLPVLDKVGVGCDVTKFNFVQYCHMYMEGVISCCAQLSFPLMALKRTFGNMTVL